MTRSRRAALKKDGTAGNLRSNDTQRMCGVLSHIDKKITGDFIVLTGSYAPLIRCHDTVSTIIPDGSDASGIRRVFKTHSPTTLLEKRYKSHGNFHGSKDALKRDQPVRSPGP